MTAADPRDGLHGLVARWRTEAAICGIGGTRAAYKACADELETALAHERPEAADGLAADQQKGGGEVVAWEASDPADGVRWVTRSPRERDGWQGLGRTIRPLIYGDTPQPSIPAPAQQVDDGEFGQDLADLPTPASHDAQQPSVRVKPLAWREHWAGSQEDIVAWRGENPLGIVVDAEVPGQYDLNWHREADPAALDAAKAKAQADYDARVLSAIEPAQQPAVVGDAIRHLTKWLDAAECECEGWHRCGRDEVQRTRDQLAALTPAATPGDDLHPGARAEWQDQVGRWWPVTIIRHRPESYDAELDDGRDALNYPRGRFRRIAAQKEGNGNG